MLQRKKMESLISKNKPEIAKKLNSHGVQQQGERINPASDVVQLWETNPCPGFSPGSIPQLFNY